MTPPEPPAEEPCAAIPDDELPPPPSDMVEEAMRFPALNVKKTKPLATIRRAFVIFEKDLRTMAKHGLAGAIILFVFLAIVFYIASFGMETAVSFKFMDGEGGGIPGASGVNPPTAVIDVRPGMSVPAHTLVTLDASGSFDDGLIVYYVWNLWDGVMDIQLYGEGVTHEFKVIGNYEVNLFVVDDELNINETTANITVHPATSDSEPPVAVAGTSVFANVGDTVTFDGTGSTDNVGITDYIWRFRDGFERLLAGPTASYRFDSAGYYDVQLIVIDASGQMGMTGLSVNIAPTGDDTVPPEARANEPQMVSLGDTVELDASGSFDDRGIVSYTWYVTHNLTTQTFTGERVTFTPAEWGGYEILLAVRDAGGNVAWAETQVIVLPEWADAMAISWTSTPFGAELSFNVLTYSYGISLLASVIYIGGLFAKGFAHEITKGTVKVLFSGPISVTTVIFSKLLYPLLLGPVFIFPLVFIGLTRFNRPTEEVLLIGLVSYALAVVTMVAAAYGSCLIYFGAKKMVLKPSVVSRMFLYFSLLATLTVFEWTSFLMDNWLKTDMYGSMYSDYAAAIAQFSPFHQGGVFLSNQLIGTAQTPDLMMLLIPVALIVLGALASRKLYTDIFSRE